jgi:hypothetical protein
MKKLVISADVEKQMIKELKKKINPSNKEIMEILMKIYDTLSKKDMV